MFNELFNNFERDDPLQLGQADFLCWDFSSKKLHLLRNPPHIQERISAGRGYKVRISGNWKGLVD